MNYRNLILCISCLFTVTCCGSNGQRGELFFSGTIEATTATLSSKVSGDVQRLFIREGSQVNPGDPLMKIDETDYQLQRNQVAAQLAQAEAALQLALKGAREEDKKRAAKNVEAAKASLDQAQADYQRITTLKNKGSATQKQLDDVTSLLEIRQAHYEAALQAHKKLLRGTRQEEIEMARAQQAQVAAALAIIDQKVSDCSITTPRAGTIIEQLVEMGELVTPGRDVVVVADLTTVTLRVYVPEQQLPEVKLDQEVKVRIDGSDKQFKGTIRYISDIAEFTPKTIQTRDERVKLVFAVEIELPNESRILKAGMPADAFL
ncbi:HlyD family secretion protein [candidate division CSSED10-310 bacterium]|uniref:HlyD family secretion protein n=1 Tax=candidate division CSSED10-310 bacterium TaxID=2855610 RepID=A0ABV6YUT1_UNCC1